MTYGKHSGAVRNSFSLSPSRSDDSCVLRRRAGGWRDGGGGGGPRGACRVCSGQEGHSLHSAGGDGAACPRLLTQLSSPGTG